MSRVSDGDTVKVHYTGKFDDGTVFDTSRNGDPLEFTLGANEVISGFEAAVVGMEAGETKTVTVPPEQAYGPHDDELVLVVERSTLPDDLDAEVGDQLEMQHPDGGPISLTVADISESTVTLDMNHPLAGEQLTFDLELVEVVAS